MRKKNDKPHYAESRRTRPLTLRVLVPASRAKITRPLTRNVIKNTVLYPRRIKKGILRGITNKTAQNIAKRLQGVLPTNPTRLCDHKWKRVLSWRADQKGKGSGATRSRKRSQREKQNSKRSFKC